MYREAGFSMGQEELVTRDLDDFHDLEWEDEMVAQRQRSRRRQPVNYTAHIEDYIRTSL